MGNLLIGEKGIHPNRTMPTNKKKKGKKNKKKDQLVAGKSADELVEAADQALLTEDADHAISLYTAAIGKVDQSGSSNSDPLVSAYEKRAQAKVSIADQDGALQDYRAALSALTSGDDTDRTSPPSAASLDVLERKAALYLYIGQLNEGKDALDVYREGIACLQQSLSSREKLLASNGEHSVDTVLLETRQQLAAAYCTVSELFLTDLCYEENAELECESYVSMALRLTNDSGEPFVDALQTAASLYISQKRGLEAVDSILRAFDQMRLGCEALASLVGLRERSNPEEAAELLQLESVQRLPGFEFRCQTAKLLLECAEVLKEESTVDNVRRNRCVQASIDVLGSLLAENDEVVEIWSLAGEAFAAMVPPNSDAASYYWERAQEMLLSVRGSLEQCLLEATDEEGEEDVQRQLDEVTCQLEDTTSKIDDIRMDEIQEQTSQMIE